MRLRISSVFAAALFAAAPCPAQHPSVGKDAPPIQASAWLNWKGDSPTLDTLKGRVVLLEFWGTWCGPCVRAMPGIQKLHDRYAERGLTVLAISYETPDVLQPFLTKNAFTMPVGSDPKKSTIGAYPIDGWPTTVVIGKDGKIAHVGSPYDAEAQVEKALGLEAGEGAVLTAYFDGQKQTDKQKKREALDRLVEKATTKFDVAAWAKGHLPAETVDAGGAPTPAPAGAPAKPVAKPANPIDALAKCGGVWADQAQRTALLRQLAEVQEPIDLAAFAQQTMAKTFPFDMAELNTLLKDEKYAAVLDAIGTRAPAAAVLNAAAKHADLAAFCKTKATEVRTNAKKAIMAQHWVFANALPKDKEVNQKFWAELSVSGMSTSEDRKTILGILLGGEQLHRDHATAFIRSQLARTFLMEDLAVGKAPRIKELPKLIDDAKNEIVRDLESRYGKPEPSVPKAGAQQAVNVPSPAPATDSDLTKNDPAIRELDAFIAGAKIDKTAENWKRMLPQPPTLPFTATNDYFWHLDTECGPITLRYFPEASPQHVSSGLYLARLGFYDGLTFHRVIPGFMAQGGDPLANGQGGPGFRIPPEYKNGLLHGKAGILSMARSREPDSAGSQFMITFAPAPTLDNQYTVWGEVTSGMETVKEIEKRGTRERNGTLATPLKIHKSWISVAPKGSTPKVEK